MKPFATISNQAPASRYDGRSPGERAFDRVFLRLGVMIFLLLPCVFTISVFRSSDATPAPAKILWSLFALAVAVSLHWLAALREVLLSWRDSSAKALRFSSLGLLALVSPILLFLLRAPFRS